VGAPTGWASPLAALHADTALAHDDCAPSAHSYAQGLSKQVFSVAIVAAVPHSIVPQPTDGLIACPALRDRPRQHALRSARANLIAPSRGRKGADHKTGGLRYPLRRKSDENSLFTFSSCSFIMNTSKK
jgi:hypothetical protein